MQMAAVSNSMQLSDEDTPIAQLEQEQQDRGAPPHPTRPPPAIPAADEHHLPTIIESALSTANSSSAASAHHEEEMSSRESEQAASEFAFDSLDVPDVVETQVAAGPGAGESVMERQITEAGQEVVTVVLSEEERQLRDSAKEMHEQGTGKGKAGIPQPPDRQSPSAQVTELTHSLQQVLTVVLLMHTFVTQAS